MSHSHAPSKALKQNYSLILHMFIKKVTIQQMGNIKEATILI